jgi:hypothetical protein
MKTTVQVSSRRPARSRAFTLAEVAVSLGISVFLIASMITGLMQTAREADWCAYDLAAQNLAQSGIEQFRAASWDPAGLVDNCSQTNFPTVWTNILDVPVVGTNFVYATNQWTITDVGTAAYPLRMVRVDCTWAPKLTSSTIAVYTNTAVSLRAPNQ